MPSLDVCTNHEKLKDDFFQDLDPFLALLFWLKQPELYEHVLSMDSDDVLRRELDFKEIKKRR